MNTGSSEAGAFTNSGMFVVASGKTFKIASSDFTNNTNGTITNSGTLVFGAAANSGGTNTIEDPTGNDLGNIEIHFQRFDLASDITVDNIELQDAGKLGLEGRTLNVSFDFKIAIGYSGTLYVSALGTDTIICENLFQVASSSAGLTIAYANVTSLLTIRVPNGSMDLLNLTTVTGDGALKLDVSGSTVINSAAAAPLRFAQVTTGGLTITATDPAGKLRFEGEITSGGAIDVTTANADADSIVLTDKAESTGALGAQTWSAAGFFV